MGSHVNSTVDLEGGFSALNLLRSYNSLIAPNPGLCRYDSYIRPESYSAGEAEAASSSAMLSVSPMVSSTAPFSLGGLLQPPLLTTAGSSIVSPVVLSHSFANARAASALSRNIIESAVISSMQAARRPRSEKKPIPDDQKDEKYYERRKRNNQAAKKSRDARKIREDHIAFRASILEQENALLRAQVMRLREECQSLRQLLIKQRMPSMQSVDQLTDRSISSTVTLTPA